MRTIAVMLVLGACGGSGALDPSVGPDAATSLPPTAAKLHAVQKGVREKNSCHGSPGSPGFQGVPATGNCRYEFAYDVVNEGETSAQWQVDFSCDLQNYLTGSYSRTYKWTVGPYQVDGSKTVSHGAWLETSMAYLTRCTCKLGMVQGSGSAVVQVDTFSY